MGQEAQCKARFGGTTSEGRLLLETDYLLFRGDFRLKIPFNTLQSVKAEKGELRITSPEGEVRFAIGPLAEKWAHKILHPPQRADKLGIKPGLRASIHGVDDPTFEKELMERNVEVTGRAGKGLDLLFFGVATAVDLAKLPKLAANLNPNGALWVVYPKGIKAITESQVLAGGKQAGLVDVKVASFSATHTALKFVVPVAKR